MNVATFMIFLFAFSSISALIVEGVKKLLKDKKNLPSNVFAIVISLIIGIIGMLLFYFFQDIPFTLKNIITAIIMGFATSLCAMVGYDKVKETIEKIKDFKGGF